MDFLASLVSGHGVASALIALCSVAVTGLALGELKILNVKLGIAGTLFAGIAFGHFGLQVEPEMLEFVREFGLILFVYAIGLQVGPGFFASLKKDGAQLNLLAASTVVIGVLVAVGIHLGVGIPLPVILGLMSGATTNTPSLAAAQQTLTEIKAPLESLAMPGLGYAVAYPFGIVGILLTMALLRAVFRLVPQDEAARFEAVQKANVHPIVTINLEVTNPNLDGLSIRQMPGLDHLGVLISRIAHDGGQHLAHPDDILHLGDVILAVGPQERLDQLRLIVGCEATIDLKQAPSDVVWERLVVTNAKVLGKRISELNLRHLYDTSISRLVRAGVELVPSASVTLQFGDILTVIGEKKNICRIYTVLGNKAKELQHAQIIPIFLGIGLGVLLGSIPLHLAGMPAALKLGLAGGPLVAAICLARLGHAGPLVWFMPPVANTVLREIGIVLFLSCVGIKAGGHFIDAVVHGDGLLWMLCAALITLIPLVVVGLIGRLAFKLNYLTLCGLLAGSMTDPPALAFANAITPSEAPALAYATVYPLVMCLRVLSPQILLLLLWR